MGHPSQNKIPLAFANIWSILRFIEFVTSTLINKSSDYLQLYGDPVLYNIQSIYCHHSYSIGSTGRTLDLFTLSAQMWRSCKDSVCSP